MVGVLGRAESPPPPPRDPNPDGATIYTPGFVPCLDKPVLAQVGGGGVEKRNKTIVQQVGPQHECYPKGQGSGV